VPPLVNDFVINAEWALTAWRGYRLTGGLVRFKETQFQTQGTKAMRRCPLRTVGISSAGLQPHAPRPNRTDGLFQDIEVIDYAAVHHIVIDEYRDGDFGFRVR
jgi:hypothetical protein